MYERIERGKNSLSRILSSGQQAEAEHKAAEWMENRKKRAASVRTEEPHEKQWAGAT